MVKCNVCQSSIQKSIYNSEGNLSITSLCETYPQKTEVFFCARCSHLQTTEIENVDEYYDQTYKILIDTEEEDQLYQVINNKKIFRIDHQVQVLLEKLTLPENAFVLDYGCAKSATLKKLVQHRPDITPHLFDVSEMYIPFWKKFAEPENWSIYLLKPQWNEYFDLVTSFFALEHVIDPKAMMCKILDLLKPGGFFYCIVPNVYTNIADFVVLDHVNHFSELSLQFLLEEAGFQSITIDTNVHNGAFVIVAQKPPFSVNKLSPLVSQQNVETISGRVKDMASYWGGISQKVREFEEEHKNAKENAIYGSGFYGTFIATCLKEFERVKYFIDQNPYRQGKLLLEKPIIAPSNLSDEIQVVYVGLNPQNASNIIESVDCWKEKNYLYFYL